MKKSKKMIIIFAMVFLLIILAIIIVINSNSSTKKWKNLMQTKAYKEAAELFIANRDIDEDVLSEEFEKAVEGTKSDFRNHLLSYQEALSNLVILRNMNYGENQINDAVDYVNRINNSAILFANAEKEYESGNYKQAILEFRQVDSEDLNFSNAQEKLAEANLKYRESVVAEADELQSKYLFDDANEIIIEAIEILNEDLTLVSYHSLLCDNAISYCEQNQDYLKAITYAESASLFEKDKEYAQIIEALRNKYFDQYIQQADAKFQIPKDDYMDAALVLEPVLKEYPEEARVKEKYEYYLSFKPVSLFEQDPFQKSVYFDSVSTSDRLDNRGNEYQYMYECGGIYEMDADWKVEGGYDLLTGVVGVPNGDFDTGVNGKIRIYGDGTLLWEKTGIDAATSPENIAIDISGVDVLKIEMAGGSAPFKVCSVMVADFTIQKTKP